MQWDDWLKKLICEVSNEYRLSEKEAGKLWKRILQVLFRKMNIRGVEDGGNQYDMRNMWE